MSIGIYVPAVTIAQVRAAKPRMIFYGANTCWWTHRERDLYAKPESEEVLQMAARSVARQSGQSVEAVLARMRRMAPVPTDPRGGVLFQTDDIEGFLRAAEDEARKRLAGHYGRHGLRAFEAAHHGNVIVSVSDRRPTCFTSWEDYNRVLDEYDKLVSA